MCVVTASGAPAPAVGKDDGDRLQGTWRCVKMVVDGKEQSISSDRSIFVYFYPGKLAFGQPDGNGVESKGPQVPFKLDTAANPRRIDIGGEKAMKGIYALDGDRLKLMHPLVIGKDDPSRRDRPEKFEPKVGDGHVYMELERVDP